MEAVGVCHIPSRCFVLISSDRRHVRSSSNLHPKLQREDQSSGSDADMFSDV